jgi:hypothetical protein
MKRFATLILMGAILLAPCIAMAGATDAATVWPGVYYFGPDQVPATNFDRNPDGTWPGIYIGALPPPPVALANTHVMVIGMDNGRVVTNKKYMTVEFTYTGLPNSLEFIAPQDAQMGFPGSSFALMKETDVALPLPAVGRVYHLEYVIVPQPNWEWIRVTNISGGPVTIEKATAHTVCIPIPSLTPYGLMLLVLLLAGAAIWVMRRRRAVLSI